MVDRDLATVADRVTTGAAGAGVVSVLIEWVYTTFGWLFSGQGMGALSLIVAIVSGLVSIYYRRREAGYAAAREKREQELHIAQMRSVLENSDYGCLPGEGCDNGK